MTRVSKIRFGVILAALCGALFVGLVPAAPAQAQRAKVIELEEEVIKGRVQKPEAFYILQHASLNYRRLDAKESFIPELVETVKDKPF